MSKGLHTATIDAEARAMQREYTRNYRQQHPEKVKTWNQNYWRRKAEERLRAQDNDRSRENA